MFDIVQERILLCPVEAMDLVDEQQRRRISCGDVVPRGFENFAKVGRYAMPFRFGRR